jgi:hypothetical protein
MEYFAVGNFLLKIASLSRRRAQETAKHSIPLRYDR